MGKTKLPWDARAAEVLAGRLKLDAVALIGLVNEVNPTGRGRDTRESATRYALKARLESLLVERFEASIEVVADPAHPGVVSLRHRLHHDVACHAIVVALEDDARSWVQRALDIGNEDDEAPARRKPSARDEEPEEDGDDPEDAEGMLRAAARAEAAYDFEGAERLYRAAYREQPDVRSAHELLRFLVDALAADADALAIEPGLPSAIRSHASIRVLLGLAAARSGDEDHATRLVLHVEDTRGAEAFVVLARAALARGDADLVAQRLAEAARADAANPELRAIGEELAKLREGQRAPLEAELAALLASGPEAEALAKAEAILARWPDSEPARRALKKLEAKRRVEEGERLVTEALAARTRGELGTAVVLFQRAIAARGDDDTRARADRALREVEAELREREVSEQAARVLLALDAKRDRTTGLTAYAEADEVVRARVIRAHRTDQALVWIDAMAKAGARGARAVVDAALALEIATACEEADPLRALAVLAPHERLLDVAAARELETRARAKSVEARKQRALTDVAAAEVALANADADGAARLLDRSARDLPDDAKPRVQALRAKLAVEHERRDLLRRFERARAGTNYHEARRALAALIAATEGEERGRREEQARSYEREIQSALDVRVDDFGPAHPADPSDPRDVTLSRGNLLHEYPSQVVPCVDLEAGVLVLPNYAARRLFVRSYALDGGKLLRSIEVTPPDDFYEPKVAISGDRLLCTGGGSGMLELSHVTGEALRWSLLRDPARPNRRLMDALQPVVGGRYIWVQFDDGGPQGGVMDLDGERPYRDIPFIDGFDLLPGVEPARVCVARNDSVMSVHEPGGVQTARYEFSSYVRGVAPHLRDEWLVVGYNNQPPYPAPAELLWVELAPNGERGTTGKLEDAQPYSGLSMACARDVGMFFIRHRSAAVESASWLLALGCDPGSTSLREMYRVPLGDRRILAQDPRGRRVFLIGDGEDGVHITPLGREPPELPDLGAKQPFRSPLDRLWSCTERSASVSSNVFAANFKWRSNAEVRRRALEMREAAGDDKNKLLELFGGLGVSCDAATAREVGAWLHERWPDDPEMEQARWAGVVVDRKWSDMVALLEPLDPAAYPDPVRQHRHHVLAAAHFALGDLARAEEHLAAARSITGSCQLAALETFAAAVTAVRAAGRGLDVPHGLPAAEELLALTEAADVLLARGERQAVLDLFDRRSTFEFREVQQLARLAVAHLGLEATTPRAVMRRRFAFGALLDTMDEPRLGFRFESLVPGATWSEERLDALAAEVRASLAKD